MQVVDADGNPCARHISCTVEMLPPDQVYDVAVIDEIQMIGDQERGWAWTRAFLGCQAREVHLCGDVTTGRYLLVYTCRVVAVRVPWRGVAWRGVA